MSYLSSSSLFLLPALLSLPLSPTLPLSIISLLLFLSSSFLCAIPASFGSMPLSSLQLPPIDYGRCSFKSPVIRSLEYLGKVRTFKLPATIVRRVLLPFIRGLPVLCFYQAAIKKTPTHPAQTSPKAMSSPSRVVCDTDLTL